MFKGKRILFFVPGVDVLKGAVYYSQVFGLAQYLVRQGARCMIVESAYGETRPFEKNVDGIEIVSCPPITRYVPLPFMPLKDRAIVKPAWKKMVAFKPTHIYARKVYSGIAALKLARKTGAKIVFSRRGLETAEMGVGGRLKDRVKMHLERAYTCYLMRRSAHVSMVASALVEDTDRFNKNHSVLPCCVMEDKFVVLPDSIRRQCREELSIPQDAKVVIYSGSMGHYQIPEVFLGLMKRLHQIDEKLVFLILTEMLDVFKIAVEKVGLPDSCYRVHKCRPQDVSKYLQCADVGIILRKNDLINKHASPVKIAEYLASGLGLIVSPWIGDSGKWLAEEPFAFLFTNDSDVADVVAYVEGITDDKKACAVACARRHYTYEGNHAAIEKMFG